jgi:hypothetical protein
VTLNARHAFREPAPLAIRRGGSLLAFALLVGCAMLPAPPRMGGTGVAPVPEVVLLYPWMADVRRPLDLPQPTPAEELAIAADIEGLLTGDFDIYPSAGRRLVVRGEIVLPYLGHAAERHPSPLARRERVSIVFAPLLAELPPERLLVALASAYAATRAAAADAAGERRLDVLGQRLIEMLDDPDLRVRHASVVALRKTTGEFLGYRPDDPERERAEATLEWQEYWRKR